MAKLLILFTVVSLVSYGLCLSCNQCLSEKPCDGKPKDCAKDKTVCLSLEQEGSDNAAYWKGCGSNENICKEKKDDYPQCEACKEDNCNTMKFT